MGDESKGAAKDISTLRSELEEMLKLFKQTALAPYETEQALYDLGAAMRDNGKDFSEFSEGGRSNMKALEGVVDALMNSANGSATQMYTNISGFMAALKASGYGTAAAYEFLEGVLSDIAGRFNGPFIPGAATDFTSFFEGIKFGAGTAKSALDKLMEAIDKAFRKLDMRVALNDSLASLKQSLLDNGNSFSAFSESGRENIGALRDTIDSLAEASNGNRKKFSSDLNALKIAMQDAGFKGSRSIGIINKALKASGVNAKASSSRIKEFAAAINMLDAQRVVGVASAIERLSSSVMDYLNARWMLGNVQLEIAAGWEEIANSTADAREEVEDISDEIAGFAADRGILEYQLGIAIKYGDTLRANELRAQIAELNQREQELIDQTNEAAAQAQQQATPQADLLAQQQALQNMVQYYVQMGAAEVISAKNKKEAKSAIKETVTAFEEQARAAGVSEDNIKKYAKELREGLKLARELNKPAEYKINARTQAALTQIRQFRDSANAAINAIRTNLNFTASTPFSSGGVVNAATGGAIRGPGTGTSDSIPAMLSNGEYVVRASAVKSYGVDFMNSLNNMTLKPGSMPNVSAGAAQSSDVVYLSPEDRALLRAAVDRPINLYSDSTKIAQSANQGNVLLAQRGLN
jgi:hypothetical protein